MQFFKYGSKKLEGTYYLYFQSRRMGPKINKVSFSVSVTLICQTIRCHIHGDLDFCTGVLISP